MPNKLNQIYNILKEMKGLIYLDNPQSKYNIHQLLRSLGVTTYEGQKRIVFDSPLENELNIIYKIGTTETGVRDNASEVAMYQLIKLLKQQNIITEDEFLLFPSAETINEDPFIIKNEKCMRPDSCEEFIKFCNEYRRYSPGVSSDVELWALFIIQYRDPITNQRVLFNDYIKGQKVLSRLGVISDNTLKEPLNFCVRNINGTLRLAFIDLGSCVPYFSNDYSKANSRIVCPKCGNGHLHYIALDIDPDVVPHSEILHALPGIYACSNPACPQYAGSITERLSDSGKGVDPLMYDYVVYDHFMRNVLFDINNYADINFMLAFYGNYFFPKLGLDKAEFYNNLMGLLKKFGVNEITGFKLNSMYENYIFKTLSLMIKDTNQPMYQILNNVDIKKQIITGALPYSAYFNTVAGICQSYGITAESTICKIASITYLSLMVAGYNVFIAQPSGANQILFYTIYGLDIQNFASFIGSFLGNTANFQQEVQRLHQHLSL